MIAIPVQRGQILEQSRPCANHPQQSASRCVVLFVQLEVLGQLGDAFREQSDLDFGGTRVLIVLTIVCDHPLLTFRRHRHLLTVLNHMCAYRTTQPPKRPFALTSSLHSSILKENYNG